MKIVKGLLKTALAGILAVAILSGLFFFYTFMPIHKANKGGNTDYIWPENARWFKMTEGISTGKFDANGFNNLQVIEEPDILILGSSHMEATDVNQEESMTVVLNDLLKDQFQAYNMGISGHTLTKIANYLPVTLDMYKDKMPKYIVIEISNPVIKQSAVDNILNHKVPVDPSYDTGLIAKLQSVPFFRLVYQQTSGGLLKLFMPETKGSGAAEKPAVISEAAYDGMFTYLQETMENSGARLILLYQPTGQLQKDGSVKFESDPEAIAMMTQKCQDHGFTFVDMTEPFTQLYETSHKLPHGFVTGEIGVGHLNADGHAVMAQTLADTITRLEQEG